MMTQGKTGYWFRSLKVRPGGGREMKEVQQSEGKTKGKTQRDLCHVGRGLTRDGVEEDEVLEVGYLPSLPALSHVGGFEQLLRCGKRDAPA